jgi:hypothetical protein
MTSSSMVCSASSADGKLVAILVPSQQQSQQQRLRVQVYQTSPSHSTCSLQQTLTATTTTTTTTKSSSSSSVKLVFATTNVLIALVGNQEIILWDLARGVVADTITSASSAAAASSSSKKKMNKKKSDQDDEEDDEEKLQFLDLAVPVVDSNTNSSSSSSSSSLSPEFFVLVSSNNTTTTSNGKLYTYEYQGSKLIRKIKSGKLEGEAATTAAAADSSHLAVSATHILVHTPGSSSIRCMDRSSGAKTGKMKLFSHIKNHASSSSSSLFLMVSSTMMICPNDSNTLLILGGVGSGATTTTTQQPQNIGLYNIETGHAYVEQFLAPSKNSQETSSSSSSTKNGVQFLSSDQKNETFTLLIHQTMYQLSKLSASSSLSQKKKLETISQLVTVKPGPLVLHFLSTSVSSSTATTTTPQKLLVLQAGGGGTGGTGGEWCNSWYTLDRSTLAERIEIGAEHKKTNDNDKDGTKRKEVTTMTTTILGPGQAGSESRTVTVAEAPAKKKIKTINNTTTTINSTAGGEEDDTNENEDDPMKDDDDDDDDAAKDEAISMSIAERLERLTKVMDEEDDDDDDNDNDDDNEELTEKQKTDQDIAKVMKTKFQPKRATTESLAELLTQALQSNNDALLELALTVRDATVISKTLSDLEPSSLLVVLLGKLTTRLASSPLRAPDLVTWLSPCLKQGHVRSNKGSTDNSKGVGAGSTPGTTLFQTQQVAALRNLLHERMESFQDLVRLEGRLSMMCD